MGRYTQETYPIRLFFNLQTEAIAFIDEHPEYGEKGVQTAIPSVVYALSCLKSPYELGITLDNTFIENGYRSNNRMYERKGNSNETAVFT